MTKCGMCNPNEEGSDLLLGVKRIERRFGDFGCDVIVKEFDVGGLICPKCGEYQLTQHGHDTITKMRLRYRTGEDSE